MQPIDRFLGTEDLKDKIRSKSEPIKVRICSSCSPKYKLKTPRLHSGAAIDRPETTNLLLPLIPEVVWQQPQETHLTNIHKISTTETLKNTHTPEIKQRNDVELQTSAQVTEPNTEPFLQNQTGSTPVQILNDSKKRI